MALPRFIMVVVKLNLKLASTTISRALNIDKSVMPPSCLKLFGKLKTQERTPSLNGVSRLAPHHTIRDLDGSYNLCLAEKLFILRADPTTTLNKRSELNGKCRHENKFKVNLSYLFAASPISILELFCV